jgi:SPP1 family predicted phage head-tail adaptor
MNIGKLDRQIVIQRKTTTRDSEGAVVETWADYRTVSAEKLDVGGAKGFRGGALRPETETVFTVRYNANFTALDRIVYRGVNYSILAIAEIDRREGLRIQTRTEAVQP